MLENSIIRRRAPVCPPRATRPPRRPPARLPEKPTPRLPSGRIPNELVHGQKKVDTTLFWTEKLMVELCFTVIVLEFVQFCEFPSNVFPNKSLRLKWKWGIGSSNPKSTSFCTRRGGIIYLTLSYNGIYICICRRVLIELQYLGILWRRKTTGRVE